MTAVSRDRYAMLPEQRGNDATRGIRGLLHDLGHQLMTLSLLAESIRSDEAIPGKSRRRIELVKQETFRAMDMITEHLAIEDPARAVAGRDPVDIRELAGQAAQVAELAHAAKVELLPGQPAFVRVSPTSAWRVLFNLVDNAARSAGPGGHVWISVRQDLDTVIDVVDDGPGIGYAPSGVAGLGLSVVARLLDADGGRLDVSDRPGGGRTRARAVLGSQPARTVAPERAGSWR